MKVKISPQRKNNRGMRHEGERVTFFAKALQAIHKTINDLQIRTPAQANTSKFLLGTTKKTKKICSVNPARDGPRMDWAEKEASGEAERKRN